MAQVTTSTSRAVGDQSHTLRGSIDAAEQRSRSRSVRPLATRKPAESTTDASPLSDGSFKDPSSSSGPHASTANVGGDLEKAASRLYSPPSWFDRDFGDFKTPLSHYCGIFRYGWRATFGNGLGFRRSRSVSAVTIEDQSGFLFPFLPILHRLIKVWLTFRLTFSKRRQHSPRLHEGTIIFGFVQLDIGC